MDALPTCPRRAVCQVGAAQAAVLNADRGGHELAIGGFQIATLHGTHATEHRWEQCGLGSITWWQLKRSSAWQAAAKAAERMHFDCGLGSGDLPHTPRQLLQCMCSWSPTGCSCRRMLQGACRRQPGLLPPGPGLRARQAALSNTRGQDDDSGGASQRETLQGAGSLRARSPPQKQHAVDRVTAAGFDN